MRAWIPARCSSWIYDALEAVWASIHPAADENNISEATVGTESCLFFSPVRQIDSIKLAYVLAVTEVGVGGGVRGCVAGWRSNFMSWRFLIYESWAGLSLPGLLGIVKWCIFYFNRDISLCNLTSFYSLSDLIPSL